MTLKGIKKKQTLRKEDIHTISLQKSKVGNKTHSDRFIISCKYCGSGHNKVNVHINTKLATNVTKYAILPVNVDKPTDHKVKVTRQEGHCRGNQLQQSDQKKAQKQAYPAQSPYTSQMQRDALVLQSLALLMTTLTI